MQRTMSAMHGTQHKEAESLVPEQPQFQLLQTGYITGANAIQLIRPD